MLSAADQPMRYTEKVYTETRNQQQVNLAVRESIVPDHKRHTERRRTSQGGREDIVSAGKQESRSSHPQSGRGAQAVFAPPQVTTDRQPDALTASKSRYRRQQPQTLIQVSEDTRAASTAARPSMLPPKMQHDHRDAMRKFQKQASFPSQTQQPPRLLTKASLDQVPNDVESESAVIQRRISQIKAQGLQRRKTEQDEAERAQRDVKRLLDSEAERQKKMQDRIRAEKEELDRTKTKEAQAMKQRQAEDAQREKERQLEERERRIEEKERQQRLKEAGELPKTVGTAVKHEKQAQTQTKPQTEPSGTPDQSRGRRESNEQRVDRHRKRSLSALEGTPIMKKSSRDEVPPVPPSPADPPDSKMPFVGFLKKRRPIDASKPQTPDRSKSQRRPNGKDIKQGGGGIVPGIDAPISAVNAGERVRIVLMLLSHLIQLTLLQRVLVECNKSSMFMPVTPTTTPVDLIRSAATVMSESIDAKASVLIESFGKVGVQRPLRKYEHIRDIMNSWDDDQQNSLILMPSATGGQDADLEPSNVQAAQPQGFGCYMHYSQKPGKWDKKWIALRPDGQITFAKNETHKDTTNICHMTDFDIYTPEHRSLSKKVKPPKKICFAIKSQQKSSMFMSLEDFVHFFSTSDKQIASDWYKAIQGWRSWYLVNVLGEGKKPGTSKAEGTGGPLLADMGNSNTGHLKSGSVDSHYQLGSFKPLLDFDVFGSPEKPEPNENSHARNHSSRGDGPPSAFPKWLIDSIDTGTPTNHNRNATNSSSNTNNLNRSASIKRNPAAITDPKLNTNLSTEDSTFAAGGLLGRSYSTRQKQYTDRDANATNTNTSTSAGPFMHGGLLDSIGQSQSQSQSSKLLIDSATSPESSSAVPVSSSNSIAIDHRARPPTRGTDGVTQNRGRGGGVMDGSTVRATGPLLDVSEKGLYTEGSLLHKREIEAPREVVLDRSK